MKKTKRLTGLLLALLLAAGLAACGSSSGQESSGSSSVSESAGAVSGSSASPSSGSGSLADEDASASSGNAAGEDITEESTSAETEPDGSQQAAAEEAADLQEHTIAVLVYDRADDEVVSFRKYLQEYLGPIFNVNFLYSDSITSGEEALSFIREAAGYGAEGVMSFNSYDLEAETALCEEKGLYFMMASGTVSDKEFEKVEKNPYFLGVIGPGRFIEYKAGSDMVGHFIEAGEGSEYFILSGGGCLGNEMHYLRTVGILDTLQNAYDTDFGISTDEIARSDKPFSFEDGNLKVTVSPGYFTVGDFLETAQTQYAEHPYGIVLAVLPAAKMLDTVRGAKLGMIDCYSEQNLQLFANGSLNYLTGKYSSIIGPSFAAMYNAVTGHADEMRENGRAFYATQGFWSSTSLEDYTEKYAYASSLERNAYNYEDLQRVILLFNKDASVADLKDLAKDYTFDGAVQRRTAQ